MVTTFKDTETAHRWSSMVCYLIGTKPLLEPVVTSPLVGSELVSFFFLQNISNDNILTGNYCILIKVVLIFFLMALVVMSYPWFG